MAQLPFKTGQLRLNSHVNHNCSQLKLHKLPFGMQSGLKSTRKSSCLLFLFCYDRLEGTQFSDIAIISNFGML